MSKSEQIIQNELYTDNVVILDKFECLSLGATTVQNLINSKIIRNQKVSSKVKNKRPDVLIIDDSKNIIIYQEQKIPNKFKSEKDIQMAIQQEIDVARELMAKIYIVSDGTEFIWINPLTGDYILDENGNRVNIQVKPKENAKVIAKLINDITLSIDYKTNQILKRESLDPTDLAKKINRTLKKLTFSSAKMSLYTFVEMFLFKYLSDIKILTGENSFDFIENMYSDEYKLMDNEVTDAKVLGKYLDGAREKMKALFPEGEDGTSVVNGQIFHVQTDKFNNYVSLDNTDVIFKEVVREFKIYEKEHGKFINISKDFKSKLFETFMKNSEDKSEMGQFFTPLKIVEQMISMVDINENMTIGDPACGVGKFLLESIEDKLKDFYSYENGQLNKKVELIGYDKMMSDKDDITIILAKANTLIYFSELFKENSELNDVQNIADSLLNETYFLNKSVLGTLDNIEYNKYDLIFANPPYYPSKTMSDGAKNTGQYTLGGAGVEALFLEWILKSLKPGGTANIVLPDGIFSNLANRKLKKNIIQTCFIECIISLPINSFFNTPKKTYILTLRKKTEYQIDNNVQQDFPIFSYIAKSIGETLDVYRFDDPENDDLKEATTKYNFYRKSEDRNNILEPIKSHLAKDSQLKFINIDELTPEKSWIIENWWTEEEKISLGLLKEKKKVTVDEFQYMIEDMISLMKDFKEELEWLK